MDRRTWIVLAVIAAPIAFILVFIGGLVLIASIQQSCGTVDDASSAAIDPSSLPDGPVAGYSGSQLANAAQIMRAGKALGLTLRDQTIGVMTAMHESGLRVLDHGDRVGPDSRGLFQQRANGAWGSLADRMDPYRSATSFFKALERVDGRETLEPTIAAHRVQGNADPYGYRPSWEPAQQVVAALGNVRTTTAGSAAAAGGSGHYAIGPVKPQTQQLADLLGRRFTVKTIGGYRAGDGSTDHASGLAIDLMVYGDRAKGQQIADYARANADQLGIQYVIWDQQIWNISRAGEGWRPMTDRGSPTANHKDHVHITLRSTAKSISLVSSTTRQQATGQQPPMNVRVTSFNIMTGRKTPRALRIPVPARDVAWSARQPQVIAWLRNASPDIAGLQENEGIAGSSDRQSDRIAPLMPEYGWAEKDTNLPIAYKTATFTLAGSGQFQINWKGKDSSRFDRWTTWARLKSRGGELLVFNVHTHPYQTAAAARARSASYDRLEAGIQRVSGGGITPYVVVGDFNARNDETRPVYRDHLVKLKRAGLTDSHDTAARITSAVAGAASYGGYGIEIGGRWRYRAVRNYDYHYDYVWTSSGITARSWRVETGPDLQYRSFGGRRYAFYADKPLPSDHLPVTADLVINGTTTATDCTPTGSPADTTTQVGAGGWTRPASGPITDPYGWRIHPITHTRRFHYGTDIGGACGSAIRAPHAATVVGITHPAAYGTLLELDHGGGVLTRYGHMSTGGVLVHVGDQVTAGQQIAKIGSAGWSTGCHVHVEVSIDTKTVNPVDYFAHRGVTLG